MSDTVEQLSQLFLPAKPRKFGARHYHSMLQASIGDLGERHLRQMSDDVWQRKDRGFIRIRGR